MSDIFLQSCYMGYYILNRFFLGESLNCFVMLFMAFLICQMAVLVFAYPKYNTQQIFAGFFGMFYVGSDALLHLSDKKSSGRNLLGMACICMLLGM